MKLSKLLSKEELKKLGILLIAAIIVFKIVFYKESLFTVIKLVLSLFWLFLLPGYALLLYWKEKLNFTERFIIAIPLGAAFVGITSYYLGIGGLHVKYHSILPVIFILIGIFINHKKNKR